MDLARYLERKGLTQTAFAAAIGTSQRVVSHWVAGRNKPRLKMMGLVESETNGAVRMEDFLAERPKPKRKNGGKG